MSRDPEKGRAASRRWYQAHAEQEREKDRRWREANRDEYLARRRQAYAADPERERERSRRWREANPDKARRSARLSARRSRQANPERYNEQQRRYRAAHPEQFRGYQAARTGRFIQEAHDMLPEDWARSWVEQDGRCYLCYDPLPEGGDHRAVVVEHDHRCPHPRGRSCALCRRGLACQRCNKLIALADDDPKRLRRIAANLERANRLVDGNLRRARRQGTLGQLALFGLADLTAEAGGVSP